MYVLIASSRRQFVTRPVMLCVAECARDAVQTTSWVFSTCHLVMFRLLYTLLKPLCKYIRCHLKKKVIKNLIEMVYKYNVK